MPNATIIAETRYVVIDEEGFKVARFRFQADAKEFAKAVGYVLSSGPHVGDGSGDAALAIGEHAFLAGWDAAMAHANYPTNAESIVPKMDAWSEYDPPEEIKALS